MNIYAVIASGFSVGLAVGFAVVKAMSAYCGLASALREV